MNFYAKGPGKSQISIQIGKLASEDMVEREREAWKKAAERLVGMLA